jgi:hypothetical protein
LWDFRPYRRAPTVTNVAAMYEESQSISILSETECWNLLSSVALGRLVTSVDGQPEIFPLNFVVQHRTVLFRTAEGAKLVSAAINDRVLFEADDHGVTEGWSVIVKPKFPPCRPVVSRPCRCEQVLRGLRGPSYVDMYSQR